MPSSATHCAARSVMVIRLANIRVVAVAVSVKAYRLSPDSGICAAACCRWSTPVFNDWMASAVIMTPRSPTVWFYPRLRTINRITTTASAPVGAILRTSESGINPPNTG